MIRFNRLLAILLAICLFASSCSKSGAKPSPPVVPPPDTTTTITTRKVGTMTISLLLTTSLGQAELIIAEPGGKVLLDTLPTAGAPVIAALKTNDTLLDVTQVYEFAPQNFYVAAYKSINPSRVTTLSNITYQVKTKVGGTSFSTIFYQNIPAGILSYSATPVWFFTNYPNNQFGNITADPSYGNLKVDYQNYAGNYAYLLFPGAGLYSLHMQVNV